jgi:hypothetical protein
VGGLKKAATGVLAPLSCSRTHMYVPRAKRAAALVDGIFEPSLISSLDMNDKAMIETCENFEYSIVP